MPEAENATLGGQIYRYVDEGKWEDIGQSFRMAKVLGDMGIPNWVDSWGKEWDHDWVTWRAKLPAYLDEWTRESREAHEP